MSASEAIDPRVSVLVSASAGTGKTFLLVSRMLRLLLEGVDPSRLLAITFTRKAAGEMHERLLARLRHLAECDAAQLDAALGALGLAASDSNRTAARHQHRRLLLHERGPRIQTFHAFCVDLLRRFPLDAPVPAGFSIAESTELLLQEAWDELFARATRAPDGEPGRSLQHLFESYGSLDRTRRSLFSFVAHRGDWWPFTHGCRDALAHAREVAAGLLQPSHADGVWPGEATREALLRYAELLCDHGNDTNLRHAETVRSNLDADGDGPFAALLSAFFRASDLRQPRDRKRTKVAVQRLGEAGARELVDLHVRLQHDLDEQRALRDTRAYAALSDAWLRAGSGLLNEYQLLKRRRRVLDFADLEWQSLRLLHDTADAEWVQFKLDQRIDHVLIDEFQDTNPTQWRLLLPLLEELAARRDEGRSVFIVGDRKQSIYGFRRADPAVQDTAADWLRAHAAGVMVNLDRSYRAAPPLMQTVNQVFGGSDSRLEGFHPHETNMTMWGRVEVLPLVEREEPSRDRQALRDPLAVAPRRRGASAHAREGELLAAHMQDLVARGTLVEEDGALRPLRFGDIMMLLRSRTHAADYERALVNAGIPFLSTDFGTLLEALEIRDVVALIQTLSTPFNDVALAQVLRSPMFAADHPMLELLALNDAERGWYTRLPAVSKGFDAAHPLARAARLLPRWRELLGKVPTHDLLHTIFHEGDIIARYRLAFPEPLNARSTRNLSRLLELALELDSGRYPSPHGFLAHLQALRETQRDAPSEPPQQLRDRLRLMTVHAAKGLEAPLVYIADAAAPVKPPDAYAALIDWPPQAAQPRCFLPGIAKTERPPAIAELQRDVQRFQQREEQNLLYVAITRARQLLVVSATQPPGDWSDSWYAQVHARLGEHSTRAPDGRLCFGDTPAVDVAAARTPTEAAAPSRTLPRPSPSAHRYPPQHPSARDAHSSGQAAPGDGLARGESIHRLLEALAPPAPAPALENLRSELALDPAAFADLLREARRVLETPALRHYFDPACYTQAWNEVPVSYYDAGDDLVSGVIDRLVKYPHAVVVIDYKSHQIKAHEAAGVAAGFAEQLQAYAQGVARIWPDVPVQTLVLFTALPLAVDVTPAEGQQLALFQGS